MLLHPPACPGFVGCSRAADPSLVSPSVCWVGIIRGGRGCTLVSVLSLMFPVSLSRNNLTVGKVN